MEQISVTRPISQAIERVRQILFNPFDLGKWFTIGFCAWLARLGESGGSGGGNFNGNSNHGGDVHQQFEHARTYVVENLYWIMPVAICAAVFIFALMAIFIWLNSRGKFMFLHCVALNRAEVVEPWHRYEAQANSLFWFRLALAAIWMVIAIPFAVLMVIVTLPMFRNDAWNFGGMLLLGGLFTGLFLIGMCFLLIRKLTTDFVVPIMFLRGNRCVEAWREFRQLLGANFGNFVLYLLFQIVIGLVVGLMTLAILIACCLLCCVLAIPYLGTVLLLPLIMFHRAYSLCYLAQYGPRFNVFPPETAMAMPR
jgi:hypothetical protein